MFRAQLLYTHQLLQQTKHRKFKLPPPPQLTLLPSERCRLYIMDIWKNPMWPCHYRLSQYVGVRMHMSWMTPASSSNFSWTDWCGFQARHICTSFCSWRLSRYGQRFITFSILENKTNEKFPNTESVLAILCTCALICK